MCSGRAAKVKVTLGMSMMALDSAQFVARAATQDRDTAAHGDSALTAGSDWPIAQTGTDPHCICFTPGTMILTDTGERPVETLRPGDRVITRDNGGQHIRWIGRRCVDGQGALAPVSISPASAQGGDAPLLVSPDHRVLYTGYMAELLFGEVEVLVAAKDLVDGQLVQRQACDRVTYLHIMFDHHEVIYANGIGTESFLASDTVLSDLEETTRNDLFSALPGLRSAGTAHLKPARPCLATHEARLLSRTATTARRLM